MIGSEHLRERTAATEVAVSRDRWVTPPVGLDAAGAEITGRCESRSSPAGAILRR